MTQLSQASSTIADTSFISISTWFRFPRMPTQRSGGSGFFGWVDLLAWGNPSSYENLNNSCISLGSIAAQVSDDWSTSLNFDLVGVFLMGNPGGGGDNDPPWGCANFGMGTFSQQGNGQLSDSAPSLFGQVALTNFSLHNTPVMTGVWNHLFVSVDTSADDTAASGIVTLNKRLNVILNRVDVFHGDDSNVIGLSAPSNVGTPPPTVTFPAFDVSVGGREMGLPTISNYQSTSPSIIRAETQIWFGTYIDPSNIGLFIDTTGRPVNPLNVGGAWQTYGLPNIAFRRSSRDHRLFQNNQGTGGLFTMVGTPPADFTPGPGQ